MKSDYPKPPKETLSFVEVFWIGLITNLMFFGMFYMAWTFPTWLYFSICSSIACLFAVIVFYCLNKPLDKY